MLASRLQTLVKAKGTILDHWLADRQEWAPTALRVPLGVIFFAHGAQKMFGWFGGYGWNGKMQYFTQSLHIPAPLAAVAILIELWEDLRYSRPFSLAGQRSSTAASFQVGG